MDGFVVPEESKDILLAAWDEEQEIIAEKEAQVKIIQKIFLNVFKQNIISEKGKTGF